MINKIKLKEIIILLILVILAFWLSPFIILGGVIYFAYKIRKHFLKKKLLEEINKEWFPKRKHVFFLYSDSKKWKVYFEEELIPKIQDKAYVWNWSNRLEKGWNNDLLEARILKLYRPIGFFYPMAIVFLPDGEIKTFQFYYSYIKMLKSGKDDYKKLENEFLNLISKL